MSWSRYIITYLLSSVLVAIIVNLLSDILQKIILDENTNIYLYTFAMVVGLAIVACLSYFLDPKFQSQKLSVRNLETELENNRNELKILKSVMREGWNIGHSQQWLTYQRRIREAKERLKAESKKITSESIDVEPPARYTSLAWMLLQFERSKLTIGAMIIFLAVYIVSPSILGWARDTSAPHPESTAKSDFTPIPTITIPSLDYDCSLQSMPEECAALAALYANTGGSTTWITETRASWLKPETSPCAWKGITCNVTGSVSSINLPMSGLSGTLPSLIGNLTSLIELDLTSDYRQGFRLTGPLPESMKKLVNLQTLYLGYNRFEGKLPEWIDNLSMLRVLDLYQSPITGTLPSSLFTLNELTHLNLNETQISGPIPREIGNLEQLKLLYLSSPNLSGEIPDSLGRLMQLTNLIIWRNESKPPKLYGTLSWLKNLEKLEWLAIIGLDGASEESRIPTEIGSLRNLKVLSFANNQITGSIPDIFHDLQQLECLDLHGNRFTGLVPPSILNLGKLKGKGCEQAIPGVDGLNLAGNSLNVADEALRAFLNEVDPDWMQTQTYSLVASDTSFPFVPVPNEWLTNTIVSKLDDKTGYIDNVSLRITIMANAFTNKPNDETKGWLPLLAGGVNGLDSPLGRLEYQAHDLFVVCFRAKTDGSGVQFYRDERQKDKNIAPLRISFQGDYGSDHLLYNREQDELNEDWRTIIWRTRAPTTRTGLRLFVYFGSYISAGPTQEHNIWIDDVKVYHMPNPSKDDSLELPPVICAE